MSFTLLNLKRSLNVKGFSALPVTLQVQSFLFSAKIFAPFEVTTGNNSSFETPCSEKNLEQRRIKVTRKLHKLFSDKRNTFENLYGFFSQLKLEK